MQAITLPIQDGPRPRQFLDTWEVGYLRGTGVSSRKGVCSSPQSLTLLDVRPPGSDLRPVERPTSVVP
jgi:hypothetical protein